MVWKLLAACALLQVNASAALQLSADGLTVYDTVNNVSWLADSNLAAGSRFGIPICTGFGTQPCVNPSGSMSYQSAAAWVQAMNAAGYLGHTNWQLPTTPSVDKGCSKFNASGGGSFGFDCTLGALNTLYYTALGFKAPNTVVPIPANAVGPFTNIQPSLYWSQSGGGANGYYTFSFNNGFKGSNTAPNFFYVLPMIQGKLAGTPTATGKGLQVNPGGLTVYDPVTNVTWLTNGNLAATNALGLAPCTSPTTPSLCVNPDGAMTWDSANQFVANMDAYNGAGYLGQSHWELPPMDLCGGYRCGSIANPMAELYTDQLGLSPGTPAVATPNIAVGPFHNIQPYLYWSCQGATIQDACQVDGPAPGFEWSFSFGNGFQGTDLVANDLYATAYFVGRAAATGGPVIAEVANAEGDSPVIAPNTWVEVKGVGLAPAGDSRIWQGSDFVGNQMPTQLDRVSVTVNGKNAFVYYISPTQINILTPPDAVNGPVQVAVTNAGTTGASFTAAQSQQLSPSFFVLGGGPYLTAVHADGSLIAPATLYPGVSSPAKPGETVLIYANGFGPTGVPVVSGSVVQSGVLSPPPVIQIGGIAAIVRFAGLVSPGEFQFNVVIPAGLGNGDQLIVATYGGVSTQSAVLLTIHN